MPRKAALRDRACEPAADGSGRPVGHLVLPSGRAGAQLCDHHHDAEQAVRGDPQPDASGLKARSAASLARREPADTPQLKALLAPHPTDEMTCWPVSARVGNMRNNDPSRIEPITGAG